MSFRMMPPKKSKAARSDNLETNEKVEDKPEPAAEMSDDVHTDEEPARGVPPKKKHFNMFEITTVEGKRKRIITATPESALSDWIAEHFEEKPEVKLPLGELYNIYLEKCVNEASTAVEPVFFNRIMTKSFPNGFGCKESSPYLNKVKEKKIKKKEPKVKADTLSIKIRDIIENSLTEMGNPRAGVRFNKLMSYVAGKYPALRIELRPKMLLTALQRGIRYGYLTCDRGIGKCGFYRRYVEGEPDEEVKKEDKENAKDGKKKDGKEGKDEEKDGEKSAEDSADDAPEKDGKKEDGKDEKKEGQDEKSPAKKKTPKRSNKPRFIHHGHPTRVEDTFYLAMTFMSEPKEASIVRIRKYIADNYPNSSVDRLAKCMEAGKERGYWEQVSGTSGFSGKFRLEVDSFDPTDDEDMTGMVINAIMACTEPKMCSANLLKKYVMEWYSEQFKVADRPHLFRKALERATANGEIKQLSGIGATGTFQLCRPFIPSPVVLAGQDTRSDYDTSDEETSDEEAIESYDYTGYGDKYKPRPSKRRGMARSKAVHAKPAVEIHEEGKKKRKRKVAGSTGRKRSRHAESDSSEESSDESSEESSSEEEAKPVKKGGRGRPSGRAARGKPASAGRGKRKASPAKKTPAKRGRPKREPSSEASDSEDESSRRKPTKTKASAKAATKKAAGKGRERQRVSYRESSSDDESVVDKKVDGYKPTPSRSRGGDRARPAVDSPPPSKGRGRPKKSAEPPMPTGRVRTPAAKKQGDVNYSSDSESLTNDRPSGMVETPAAKKQRSAPAPKSRRRR